MQSDSLTVTRAGLAILAGAAMGGLLVMLWFSASSGGGGKVAAIAPIAGAVASVIWLVGMTFAGVPVWYLLHKIGVRGRLAAVALGFVLSALGWLALAERRQIGQLTDFRQFIERYWHDGGLTERAVELAVLASMIGAMGMIVGLTVWWVAYGYRRKT
jgi:hypothetical protein